jgi:hypothetical protein
MAPPPPDFVLTPALDADLTRAAIALTAAKPNAGHRSLAELERLLQLVLEAEGTAT